MNTNGVRLPPKDCTVHLLAYAVQPRGAYRYGVKCLHIYSYGVVEYYASQNATPDPVADNNESD